MHSGYRTLAHIVCGSVVFALGIRFWPEHQSCGREFATKIRDHVAQARPIVRKCLPWQKRDGVLLVNLMLLPQRFLRREGGLQRPLVPGARG